MDQDVGNALEHAAHYRRVVVRVVLFRLFLPIGGYPGDRHAARNVFLNLAFQSLLSGLI